MTPAPAYVNGVQVGLRGQLPPAVSQRPGRVRPVRDPRGRPPPREPRTSSPSASTTTTAAATSPSPPRRCTTPKALEAIRLEGDWDYRAGDDPSWAEGPVAADEARYGQVDHFDDLDAYLRLRKGDTAPLSPEQARDRFVVADDLAVDLVVADPDIAQPLQVSFDERGRLWVVEYRQYPEPAGLKVLSRDKFLRIVYDTVPEPPPHGTPGLDRISIHEDTDGDGTFEQHKVFVDGLNLATSIARGRGGVWVLNPPYLLFYPDRDGDDLPDGDPEVHLEGFGLEDSHSIVQQPALGPRRLALRRPGEHRHRAACGGPASPRRRSSTRWASSSGGITPRRAATRSSPRGAATPSASRSTPKGRIYSGHNGGDTRGFHYVQGGYYQKGFTKHGAALEPVRLRLLPADGAPQRPPVHPHVPDRRRGRPARRPTGASCSASSPCRVRWS